MLSRVIHNDFLPNIQHDLTEPGPASATEFLFGAPAAHHPAQVDGLVKTDHAAHPTQFLEDAPQESLKGWREKPHSGEIRDLRIEESGILPSSLGEHWGILKALKTTVLLTGGLCSKLFGIGLMGYLAFQSMQANVSRSRHEQAQGQYVYNSNGRRQERC